MAVMPGEISKCRPFYEKRAPCGGRNFLSHKAGGRISIRVWSCSNNNDGSVHSDNKNAALKRRRRREDVILPCDVDKRGSTTWWLPLFGWSQTDQEPWADDNINESKTRAVDKNSGDPEKGMDEGAVPKRSKFVRGRLTPEKAKLLRKNLRDTSTFHDIMYHSAIASRLASPDNEGKDLEILCP